MRYSNYDQRQMDAAYGLRMDSEARKARLALPCKNAGNVEVDGHYGSCLRCGADQGEACRPCG